MKSGFVSIIGMPNVGKSTLLNSLLEQHLSIISNVSGTTRNVIQGIYNDDDYQIVFIDTPGIAKPIDKLGKILNRQASGFIRDVDLVLFIVDASSKYIQKDKALLKTLEHTNCPVVLVLNKTDKLTKEQIINKINQFKDEHDFKEIIPISALENQNIEELLKIIKLNMTDNVRYFDLNTSTNVSRNFLISEYVREKILNNTTEEIPHSITCVTTSFEEKKDIVNVGVDIIVERDSLKRIIIGKQGSFIKKIGMEARKDVEELLGKKVYLELYVKTIKDWRNKDTQLTELGFQNIE